MFLPFLICGSVAQPRGRKILKAGFMKKLLFMVFTCGLILVPGTANAIETVFGGDGSFLGVATSDRYDQQSICNPYGPYGSKYNESIFNVYGTYGGRYSDVGAYNPRATNPPYVVDRGQVVAFITKNTKIQPRVDPDAIPSLVCGR
jgi:hypothetical protein